MKCRLCGKSALEIQGWLERVNDVGIPGLWECRPSCKARLMQDECLLGAITGDEEVEHG